MAIINNSLSVSTSYLQNDCSYENCYCNNQAFTDYPSPMSSPNSPEMVDISRNNENPQYSNTPYSPDSYDYCASPCSIITNDDIDVDLDTTSERSYTTTSYTNINISDNYCENGSTRNSKKRSFSEVDDYDIDSMDDEELESYYENIDLDLYPKVKSPSELLIFSPFVMKRFKLYNHEKSIKDESNYELNTPKIVEITDDDESITSHTSSDEIMPSESCISTPLNNGNSYMPSPESLPNDFCNSTYYNNADASYNV